jgi:hypothetical protein
VNEAVANQQTLDHLPSKDLTVVSLILAEFYSSIVFSTPVPKAGEGREGEERDEGEKDSFPDKHPRWYVQHTYHDIQDDILIHCVSRPPKKVSRRFQRSLESQSRHREMEMCYMATRRCSKMKRMNTGY